MFIKNLPNYLIIILIVLVLPFCGYGADECEVKVFDCGQGNTVVAKYKDECIAFDAGKTSSKKFAKFVEAQDEESDAGMTYKFQNNAEEVFKLTANNLLDKAVEWDADDQEAALVQDYLDFTGGKLKTATISHRHADHYSLFNKLGLDQATHVVLGGDWSTHKKGAVDVKALEKNNKILDYKEEGWKFSKIQRSPTINVLAESVSQELGLKKRDANMDSMVVKLEHNSNSILFTGDAEGETWEYINNNHPNDLKTTILILSHHGAMRNDCTSPELLELINPTVCLITAGFKHNHPSMDLINICIKYYKKHKKIRTEPHFISCCVGGKIHTYYTNFPIFTTMDSGSIIINLTKLTIKASRGLNPSSPVSYPLPENEGFVSLSYNRKDGELVFTEDELYSFHNTNKNKLKKYRDESDEEEVGVTYFVLKGRQRHYYYKLGDLFFPQKWIVEESSESENDVDGEDEKKDNG